MTGFRKGFKMKLLAGAVPDYRKRHDEIWQELSELLKASGIRDYSIFLDETDNTLFAMFTYDDDESLSQLPQNEVMRKWWHYMADLMETNDDKSPVEVPLREIFYLP